MWAIALALTLAACGSRDGGAPRAACLDTNEAEVLARHLVALGMVRDLLVEQATETRAVGFAVPPAVGILGVVGIDAPCGELARACAGGPCWSARCAVEGWEVHLEDPVSLPGGASLAHALLTRDAETRRLVWTAEVVDSGPWAVAQRGVLSKEALAVAEGYPRLREGHEVVMRVSFPASGGAVGVLEADGEPLSDIMGRTIAPTGRCMQR